MCLIIYRASDKTDAFITDEDLAMAINRNRDGIGVMYPITDLSGKRSLFVSYLMGTVEEQIAFYREHEAEAKFSFAAHCRLTTDGEDSIANCHPHKVIDTEEGDRKTVYMMHNGIIFNHKSKVGEKESDTVKFVKQIMQPLLSVYPSSYKNAGIKKMMSDYVGTNSKLLFMDDRGRGLVINEDEGIERNGMWLSNDYSVSGCTAYKGMATKKIDGATNKWCSKEGKWLKQTPWTPPAKKATTPANKIGVFKYVGDPIGDDDMTMLCTKYTTRGIELEEYKNNKDGMFYYFRWSDDPTEPKFFTRAKVELFKEDKLVPIKKKPISSFALDDKQYKEILLKTLKEGKHSEIIDMMTDHMEDVVEVVYPIALKVYSEQYGTCNMSIKDLESALSVNLSTGANQVIQILKG